MSLDTALKRPALYNPALWSRDEVRTYYVARHRLLDRFLDDFRREKPGTRPQHRLILGQRGMGKSTLLRRLAIGVDDDAELASQWLPLVFPEEQYNVATLADFWLNCLDALGDFLEARGDVAEMKAIDAEVERLDRKDGEGALQTLLRLAKKLDRRLLLLVDNIDLVLERIKDKDWVLREALQEHPELLLVGASSRALEATYDYGAAFYDFFKIDELRGLSEIEMRETIVTLARQRGAEEVARRVESDPGRLRVLHTLTGGNPRTAVLLYGVLLKGIDGDVRSDLEGLLDEVTPLYKARFDELPTQAQQLLDKVALHWDPISARQAADALGWTINLASAQLDRLVQVGVIEKVKAGKGKRMAFQVAERFFNIWYLMRASRRVRRKLMWLVEFLRVFFSSDELQRLAKDNLQLDFAGTRSAEYMLALCRAIGPIPLARALETRALNVFLSNRGAVLEEIFDISGEDSDLLSKAELIKARKAAKEKLEIIFDREKDKSLINQIVGLLLPSDLLLKVIGAFDGSLLSDRDNLQGFVNEIVPKIKPFFGEIAYSQLSEAVSNGYMEGPRDVEGGEAAALKFDYPLLGIIPKLFKRPRKRDEWAEYEGLARKAISLDETGSMYWLCLAEILADQGWQEEVREAVSKATRISHDDSDVLVRAANVLSLFSQGFSDAEVMYRSILTIDKESLKAMRGLASLLQKDISRRPEAILLVRELCEKEPNNHLNWFSLATTLAGDGESIEERLQALEHARVLAPKFVPTLAVLVGTLLFLNRKTQALDVARSCFEEIGNSGGDLELNLELLCTVLSLGHLKGMAEPLLRELDATEAAERFRPAREALAAVVAGTADVLNGIAPEVRKPALDMLSIIDPNLVAPEILSAPI